MSCELYNIQINDTYTHYENGAIREHAKVTTKKAKKNDRYDYYARWDSEYVKYDSTGVKMVSCRSYYKSATYGKNCGELINETISYYPSGKIKSIQKDKCDCRNSTFKLYDENGKRIEKRKFKLKRIE